MFDDGIDTPLDTAYNRRGDLFSTEYFPGAKNLGLSANILMRGGDPTLTEPSNPEELLNYLNGLTRTGNIFNPCDTTFGYVAGGINRTQVNPFFWFSGDPVGNIGWINNSEGDLRNIISSGRFTLEVNRPIDIWVGYIVGQGTSALNSVTVTVNYVQNAQTYFNNNFTNGTVSDVDDFSIVTEYNLSQKCDLLIEYKKKSAVANQQSSIT